MENEQSVGKSATMRKSECGQVDPGDYQVSTMYNALADRSRRLVLEYLRDCPDHTASVEQLAEYVNEQSADTRASSPPTLRLHHVHLPKLDEMEVLEYDRESGVVHYQPNAAIEDLLHQIPK